MTREKGYGDEVNELEIGCSEFMVNGIKNKFQKRQEANNKQHYRDRNIVYNQLFICAGVFQVEY